MILYLIHKLSGHRVSISGHRDLNGFYHCRTCGLYWNGVIFR